MFSHYDLQLARAKELFMEDPKYQKKGFKYDHVWNMIKDFVNVKDNVPTARNRSRQRNIVNESSQSDNTTSEPPAFSPTISSFAIDLDDDTSGGTSSQRPIGVKKAKLKRKVHDNMSEEFTKIRNDNEELKEILKKTNDQRQAQIDAQQKHIEMQRRKLDLKEKEMELKIMLQDPNGITDPNRRAYIISEQARITQKRYEQQLQQHGSSNTFGSFFDNIGGSGSGLPDY